MSKELNKVIEGCKNQARDLCYLSEWSKIYANDYYDEYEMFFATFDFLSGKIFLICHKVNDEKDLFALFANGRHLVLLQMSISLFIKSCLQGFMDMPENCEIIISQKKNGFLMEQRSFMVVHQNFVQLLIMIFRRKRSLVIRT